MEGARTRGGTYSASHQRDAPVPVSAASGGDAETGVEPFPVERNGTAV